MSEYKTYITMGEDYARIHAAADAALDPIQVRATATRIVEVCQRLAADPANHAETPGCISLRLIRAALTDQREYADAALRWLDTHPDGMPQVYIELLSNPSPADIAAAVFVAIPNEDEAYMANVISIEPS